MNALCNVLRIGDGIRTILKCDRNGKLFKYDNSDVFKQFHHVHNYLYFTWRWTAIYSFIILMFIYKLVVLFYTSNSLKTVPVIRKGVNIHLHKLYHEPTWV